MTTVTEFLYKERAEMDDESSKQIKKFLDAQNKLQKIIGEHDRLRNILGGENQSHAEKIIAAQKSLQPFSPQKEYATKQLENITRAHPDILNMLSGRTIALKALEDSSLLNINIAKYTERFAFPQIADAARIAEEISRARVGSLAQYAAMVPNLHQHLMSMSKPWIDTLHATKSIRGLIELQTIGFALNFSPSFDADLTDALRFDLGDWRDQITWPNEIFTDCSVRSAFYVDRGLNAELTAFPDNAFLDGLSLAGVTIDPPALIALYGHPVPLETTDAEEEAFARTNAAHDWLQRMESQLRQFIDKTMTAVYGQTWPKHRLPNGLYDKWMEKQRVAEERYGAWPLIAYADFTDYEPIICKKDNWPLFKPFFQRPESLRESFQRLYPIRICTMHCRPITKDDELFLYVEAKRLMDALLRSTD